MNLSVRIGQVKGSNEFIQNQRREDPRAGTGNWAYFSRPIEEVMEAAQSWAESVSGIQKPWLCWNVHDDWCLVQQKIVSHLGWTPIVGWDPNLCKSAPIISGAVPIDFNSHLKLKVMWPHVPLEFAFMWTEKLAFWHADLLVRLPKLKKIADLFERLKDGEMAAVLSRGGFRNLLNLRSHRYWELIGCTTKGASKSQFEHGCGWWRHIWKHPNCPNNEKERDRRRKYYYDHGIGIMYWKRHYKGKVYSIPLRPLLEGHFSEVGNPKYRKASCKTEELNKNFNLNQALEALDLVEFAR